MASILALLAVAAFRAQPGDDAPLTEKLSLTHFAVEQGTASLITTSRGRHILIDAGSSSSAVAARLKRAGIDTLDLVVSTHNDVDHIGGMPDVFANLVVLKYIDNRARCRTQVCRQTRDAAQFERGLKHVLPTSRSEIVDGVTLHILPPTRIDTSERNNSIGVLVEHGSFRALYAGDAEVPQQSYWLSQDHVPRVDLLVAPRHGASTAFSSQWMAATAPSLVVVSVGEQKVFPHPSWVVVQMWKMRSVQLLRTDTDGTVQVTASPDGTYAVETEASQAGP